MNVIQIDPGFAVVSALGPGDFVAAAGAGFRAILNFRPDGEAAGQMSSEAACRAAADAGLAYIHIPAQKFDVFDDAVVGATRDALEALPGPVLGTCGSGHRAAIAWAAATARSHPVDEILRVLTAAGLDLSFVRDDLEAQAGRSRERSFARAPKSMSTPGRISRPEFQSVA